MTSKATSHPKSTLDGVTEVGLAAKDRVLGSIEKTIRDPLQAFHTQINYINILSFSNITLQAARTRNSP